MNDTLTLGLSSQKVYSSDKKKTVLKRKSTIKIDTSSYADFFRKKCLIASNENELLFSLLKIPEEERNSLDIKKILNILNNTNILKKVKEDKLKELENDYVDNFFSKNLNIKTLNPNERLFFYNNLPDNFYLILSGSVKILVPNLILAKITRKEYFNYLEDLYNEKEYGLIKLIIKNNKNYKKYLRSDRKSLQENDTNNSIEENEDNNKEIELENFDEFIKLLKILYKITLHKQISEINTIDNLLDFYQKEQKKIIEFFNNKVTFEDFNIFTLEDLIAEVDSENSFENSNTNKNFSIKLHTNTNSNSNKNENSIEEIIESKDYKGNVNNFDTKEEDKKFLEEFDNENFTKTNIAFSFKNKFNIFDANNFNTNSNFNTTKVEEDVLFNTIKANKFNCEYKIVNKKKKNFLLSQLILNEKEKNLMEKFKNFSDEENKVELKVNKFTEIIYNEGNFFGDLAFDGHERRAAGVVNHNQFSVLGYLSKENYRKFILDKKQEIIIIQSDNLNAISIFKTIKKSIFLKNYFPQFIHKDFKKSDSILHLNEDIKKLMFVKSGKIEVSLKANVFEIENLAKLIIDNLKKMDLMDEKTEKGYKKQFFSRKFMNEMDIDREKYKKLSVKKFAQLFTIGPGEILGLEPYFLGIKIFSNGICESEKASIMSLDQEQLDNIFKIYPEGFQNLVDLSYKKLKVMLNRLFDIIDSFIIYFDKDNKIKEFELNKIKQYGKGGKNVMKNDKEHCAENLKMQKIFCRNLTENNNEENKRSKDFKLIMKYKENVDTFSLVNSNKNIKSDNKKENFYKTKTINEESFTHNSKSNQKVVNNKEIEKDEKENQSQRSKREKEAMKDLKKFIFSKQKSSTNFFNNSNTNFFDRKSSTSYITNFTNFSQFSGLNKKNNTKGMNNTNKTSNFLNDSHFKKTNYFTKTNETNKLKTSYMGNNKYKNIDMHINKSIRSNEVKKTKIIEKNPSPIDHKKMCGGTQTDIMEIVLSKENYEKITENNIDELNEENPNINKNDQLNSHKKFRKIEIEVENKEYSLNNSTNSNNEDLDKKNNDIEVEYSTKQSKVKITTEHENETIKSASKKKRLFAYNNKNTKDHTKFDLENKIKEQIQKNEEKEIELVDKFSNFEHGITKKTLNFKNYKNSNSILPKNTISSVLTINTFKQSIASKIEFPKTNRAIKIIKNKRDRLRENKVKANFTTYEFLRSEIKDEKDNKDQEKDYKNDTDKDIDKENSDFSASDSISGNSDSFQQENSKENKKNFYKTSKNSSNYLNLNSKKNFNKVKIENPLGKISNIFYEPNVTQKELMENRYHNFVKFHKTQDEKILAQLKKTELDLLAAAQEEKNMRTFQSGDNFNMKFNKNNLENNEEKENLEKKLTNNNHLLKSINLKILGTTHYENKDNSSNIINMNSSKFREMNLSETFNNESQGLIPISKNSNNNLNFINAKKFKDFKKKNNFYSYENIRNKNNNNRIKSRMNFPVLGNIELKSLRMNNEYQEDINNYEFIYKDLNEVEIYKKDMVNFGKANYNSTRNRVADIIKRRFFNKQ